MQFVFAYGSLAADAISPRPARLQGHRRVWGVAMDNRVDIPGYKSYRLRADGNRPAVFVAFLDVVPDATTSTGGALIAVDESALEGLDARERNYERVDVTEQMHDAPPGTVWAYRGSAAGRARLERGRRTGTAVADAAYVAAVGASLASLGLEDDLDPSPLALLDLVRVELAPAP